MGSSRGRVQGRGELAHLLIWAGRRKHTYIPAIQQGASVPSEKEGGVGSSRVLSMVLQQWEGGGRALVCIRNRCNAMCWRLASSVRRCQLGWELTRGYGSW